MKSRSPLEPPFLVFPDQAGGFFVFHHPLSVFSGPELADAEAQAAEHGWLAGGLQYHDAEDAGPGWWGVFSDPDTASREQLLEFADPGPVFSGPLSSLVGPADYERAFDQVKRALAAGTTYQVNLTFPVVGRAVSGLPWTWRSALKLWLELIAAQGREASFAVLGTPDRPGPVLVSASPELFFQREGSLVEARPMKGTAATRHELISSAKNRAENLMITDMLRNDLGRLAVPGGVSVPSLFEAEEYPTVWQMTSTVRAQVPPTTSLAELMRALFPCASITGAPKLRTQEVIEGAESHPRGWYTGTLGWHRPASPRTGPARSRFSVLIRTLVLDTHDPSFVLGVGGGVVWDSTAEGEWDEAWAKTRFLTPTRREFSLTEAVLWEPEGGYFLLEEHEARLSAACHDFGGRLEPGLLQRELEAEVGRLTAGRVPGPLKLRVLVDPEFRLTVHGEPLPTLPETLSVALASRPLGPETLLMRRYKTTDRLVYDQARVPGVDQTVYYNQHGELTETTTMTLVLETGGRFLTPALSCGLLGGTYRSRLLAEGRLEEAVLPIEALAAADKVWLVNSVRRWKAGERIAARP